MDRDVKRHPIRGILWGLLFGVGLYFLLIGRKVFSIGEWTPFIISIVIGIVVNVLWSMFAPAKKAKAPKGYSGLPIEPAPAAAAAASYTAAPPPPVPSAPMPAPPPVPEPEPPAVPDQAPPVPDQPPPIPPNE